MWSDERSNRCSSPVPWTAPRFQIRVNSHLFSAHARAKSTETQRNVKHICTVSWRLLDECFPEYERNAATLWGYHGTCAWMGMVICTVICLSPPGLSFHQNFKTRAFGMRRLQTEASVRERMARMGYETKAIKMLQLAIDEKWKIHFPASG